MEKLKNENIRKIYSILLILGVALSLVLMVVLVVHPKTKEAGVETPLKKNIADRDYIELYDNINVKLSLKSGIKSVDHFGIHCSNVAKIDDINAMISLSISNGENKEDVTYSVSNIGEDTIVAIFPKTFTSVSGQTIELTVTTNGVDQSNSLHVFKSCEKDESKTVINNDDTDMTLGYSYKGRTPSIFYIWYPIMMFTFLAFLSTINDWSALKKEKNNEEK